MKKFTKKMAFAFLIGVLAFTVVPATVQAAGWKQNKNGYWWQENDYSYPKNQWKTIYGKQYHFNSKGYMDTDWTKVDGKWYYFGGKNDGIKKTYWQQVRGKYYWLGSNGVMRTGWQQVYGKYYWLGGSNDGAMKTGWQKVGGKYYLLGNNGDMKSGWQTVYGKKYYLGGANDGSMKTGWQKIGGYDYYFGGVNDGALKTSTWVNGYYVDESGKWTGQESYKYSKGECVSEFGISHNKGEYSYLGFWHSYGESASCEDFIFQWKEGKYEYSVRGGRSGEMFTLKFTPTKVGMKVQVRQNDGQGYSWIESHTSKNATKGKDLINEEYKKLNGKITSGVASYSQAEHNPPIVQSESPFESGEIVGEIPSEEENQTSEEQTEESTQDLAEQEEKSETEEDLEDDETESENEQKEEIQNETDESETVEEETSVD